MNMLVYNRMYVHVFALVVTSQVCTKAEKMKGLADTFRIIIFLEGYHADQTDKCLICGKIDDQPRLAVIQVISRRY